MVKLSKKAIMGISAGSAVIIVGSTVLANIALKKETGNSGWKNPLDRGKNYHYYSILNKIQSNTKLKDLIDFAKGEKQLIYFINKSKFENGFKSIVQDALKATPNFSQNYLNYVIECNYKIKDTRSILVDLVWYEPNNRTKFYDQFELYLETA